MSCGCECLYTVTTIWLLKYIFALVAHSTLIFRLRTSEGHSFRVADDIYVLIIRPHARHLPTPRS